MYIETKKQFSCNKSPSNITLYNNCIHVKANITNVSTCNFPIVLTITWLTRWNFDVVRSLCFKFILILFQSRENNLRVIIFSSWHPVFLSKFCEIRFTFISRHKRSNILLSDYIEIRDFSRSVTGEITSLNRTKHWA